MLVRCLDPDDFTPGDEVTRPPGVAFAPSAPSFLRQRRDAEGVRLLRVVGACGGL